MEQIILFIFLIIFPFGQIIRIGIVHPIDVVVAIGAFWAILKHYQRPEVFKYIKTFLYVAVFSWILSLFLLQKLQVLYGGLYLIRLLAYSYFFVFVANFVKRNKKNAALMVNSLLSLSVISAVFGWIQYFWIKDTRPLYYLGWDDHYLRLIGTFLDPTYLGIILVFGLIISLRQLITTKSRKYIVIAVFLIISLAFTYSRASYLAFLSGLFVILLYYKKIKYFAFALLGFVVLVLALPTAKNTTLFFTRAFSAINRIENYKETLKIFETSPVFGVGYNNLCLTRREVLGEENFSSHSCSGSDSSLLFILATTGTIGFITFLWAFWNIFKLSGTNSLIASLGSAILVHSLFSNSQVYSWVMGYLLILLAAELRGKRES